MSIMLMSAVNVVCALPRTLPEVKRKWFEEWQVLENLRLDR